MNANTTGCPGHKWKTSLGIWVCTECGAPGFKCGETMQAYPPAHRERILAAAREVSSPLGLVRQALHRDSKTGGHNVLMAIAFVDGDRHFYTAAKCRDQEQIGLTEYKSGGGRFGHDLDAEELPEGLRWHSYSEWCAQEAEP